MNSRCGEDDVWLSSRYEWLDYRWKSIRSGYITTERDGYSVNHTVHSGFP